MLSLEEMRASSYLAPSSIEGPSIVADCSPVDAGGGRATSLFLVPPPTPAPPFPEKARVAGRRKTLELGSRLGASHSRKQILYKRECREEECKETPGNREGVEAERRTENNANPILNAQV